MQTRAQLDTESLRHTFLKTPIDVLRKSITAVMSLVAHLALKGRLTQHVEDCLEKRLKTGKVSIATRLSPLQLLVNV